MPLCQFDEAHGPYLQTRQDQDRMTYEEFFSIENCLMFCSEEMIRDCFVAMLAFFFFFFFQGQAVFYNQEFRNSSSIVWFELLIIYSQPDPNTRSCHFMVFLFVWTVRIISQSQFPDFSTSQTHVFFFFLSFFLSELQELSVLSLVRPTRFW